MKIERLIKWRKKAKGFLTKKGELINWKEVHALGLGTIDGVGFKNQGYRLEFWLEKHPDVNKKTMHYYEKGYFWARLLKYLATVVILLALYGKEALKVLFPLAPV